MDDRIYFIYITTNLINGKKYIGKHLGYVDDDYLGSGTVLLYAIKKYGKENFYREIIDFSETEDENCEKEKYYIALYDACDNPMFYNIHEGGSGGNTTKGYTLEQKLALSKKFSLRWSGKNNPRYGKHLSEETKQKLSYTAKNIRDNSIYRTEEYRKEMSKITSGTGNGMYGKKHSSESKRKMSEHSKGKTAGRKNGMYGKKGDRAINGIKIAACDEYWNIIKIFQCKQAALQFLGLKGHLDLDKAIKNKTYYHGYYWKQMPKNK